MKVTLWGTRGSLPSPGPSTARYGGNTACVEVRSKEGALLILDAGTGIRLLGNALEKDTRRIDLLLTHLHMDHLQGLGFFAPLYIPNREVHIWGPPSATMPLAARLERYLSPPFFPVKLSELDCQLSLHNIPLGDFDIGPFHIQAALICHPDPTLGFRVSEQEVSMAYMPDHEPFLGCREYPDLPKWTSGFDLAAGVDMLIHDAQYDEAEYLKRIGWGHSSLQQAILFANAAKVKHLTAFHHDPTHDDDFIDRSIIKARAMGYPFTIEAGAEGCCYEI